MQSLVTIVVNKSLDNKQFKAQTYVLSVGYVCIANSMALKRIISCKCGHFYTSFEPQWSTEVAFRAIRATMVVKGCVKLLLSSTTLSNGNVLTRCSPNFRENFPEVFRNSQFCSQI